MSRFPPLYQCSVCLKPVKVKENGLGIEPTIIRSCEHHDAVVWANRKVTLRGEGSMNVLKKTQVKITLSLRQILSNLTGRSI